MLFSFSPRMASSCLIAFLVLHQPGRADDAIELGQLLQNPADLVMSAPSDSTIVYGRGDAFADDRDDLLDAAFQTVREADALEARSRGLLLVPGDEQALVESLEDLDGERSSFRAGGGAVLLTAGQQNISWIFTSALHGTGRFYYDEDDEARLRFAAIAGLFNPLELGSFMRVSAVWQSAVGLNYRFRLARFPDTQLGITGKIQNISLMERRINQNDYVEKEVFRFNRDSEDTLQLNADLGLRHQFRGLGLQLVISDIYTEELEGVNGTPYRQHSQFVFAMDYRRHWGELAVRAEVTPASGFGELMPRRDHTLSGSVKVSSRFELTSSLNIVESHYENDSVSLGLRYRLQALRLAISGQSAGKRELGFQVGAQLPL